MREIDKFIHCALAKNRTQLEVTIKLTSRLGYDLDTVFDPSHPKCGAKSWSTGPAEIGITTIAKNFLQPHLHRFHLKQRRKKAEEGPVFDISMINTAAAAIRLWRAGVGFIFSLNWT